ncbi:MAG: AhpC/TSA family protein [Acidobacteria bacterium]|nr:AhpC/TSA family protein [Acidobacteriota bacterium]
MPRPIDLQTQLDNITSQTRSLVQPERLAITDAAVHELYSTGIEERILPVGAIAPSFDLPDAINGKLVRSSDLLALGPLIVSFFRGRWCPYCITELQAWQAAFPAVRERGALLVAISPQLARQNDFTVQHHSLTFPLLTDAGSTLAEAFGIAYTVPEPLQRHYRSILINIPFVNGTQTAPDGTDTTWRLPLPATFVIRPTQAPDGSISGRIVFAEAHADHRVRPDPEDVLAVL